MLRRLGLVDRLFFDVLLLWVLAGGAFYFGHLVWGALFAGTALIEGAIKTRRYLRRRSGADWYEQ